MDEISVSDLILRAVAAMREHGDLPEVETSRITVSRVIGDAATFRANAGQALAAAQIGDQPPPDPRDLADAITDYLRDVVDLVPAYHDIVTVTSTDDGFILITLRGA